MEFRSKRSVLLPDGAMMELLEKSLGSATAPEKMPTVVKDLGLLSYRDAWAVQEAAHSAVVAGEAERILLVEHPPVITFGRRAGVERNLLASTDQLQKLGVEVVQSDRGGDITFHGPGQLVAYPIVRLNDHGLSVGGYVHGLEDVIVNVLRAFGISGAKDPAAVGIWAPAGSGCGTAKVCAIGVRIRRGVSLHGLALNVTTDLNYFNLIVPCGIAARPVTSMNVLLDDATPSMAEVKAEVVRQLEGWLGAGCGNVARRSVEFEIAGIRAGAAL